MPAPLFNRLQNLSQPRINRAPSPVLAMMSPWVFVMLGSLCPLLPLIASAPVVPPLGFLFLVAWQQLRPGLFPVWAGLPLGLFDDLLSGQPLGSAMLLWSLAMFALDRVENRFPWRGFAQNWAVAAAIITAYLVLALGIANRSVADTSPVVLLPQLIVSVLAYPLCARLVGAIDRLRLTRLQVV